MRSETIGDATLYLGRCEDVLPTLGRFDAAVFDPPYGIGEAAGKNKSRSRGTGCVPGVVVRDYGNAAWDDQPLPQETVALIRACSRYQIIFGGNYYDLPPTSCWLVWDKLNGDSDFADCELAWTNLKKAVRRLRYLWCGCMRMERDEPRLHPTQKPVGVMTWAIGHLPADVRTIVDPTMGVGTTGVATVKAGKSFVGIEADETYFSHACRRLEAAHREPRLDLALPPSPTPAQPTLFGTAAG